MQWFTELYWNGFGVAERGPALSDLPSELSDRLQRGQVFVVNRPYAVSGLRIQQGPLLMVTPLLIVNLRDGSLFASVDATRELSERALVSLRLDAPIGPPGSEFGGLPPTDGARVVLASPLRIVAKIAAYF